MPPAWVSVGSQPHPFAMKHLSRDAPNGASALYLLEDPLESIHPERRGNQAFSVIGSGTQSGAIRGHLLLQDCRVARAAGRVRSLREDPGESRLL